MTPSSMNMVVGCSSMTGVGALMVSSYGLRLFLCNRWRRLVGILGLFSPSFSLLENSELSITCGVKFKVLQCRDLWPRWRGSLFGNVLEVVLKGLPFLLARFLTG